MDRLKSHDRDTLPFVKMQGAGNDFIMIDGRHGHRSDLQALVPRLCDRRFGIGADGVIVLAPSKSADARMIYFNADGSETICGNGMRCLARFALRQGMIAAERKDFEIETKTGIVAVRAQGSGERVGERVIVEMGIPVFDAERIPVSKPGPWIERELEVADESGRTEKVKITTVSMGNPHCVIFVDDVKTAPVTRLGPLIERHPLFPERTNVEFVTPLSLTRARMRVWERGVGETLACGTGICASLAALVTTKRTQRKIVMETPGGELDVQWDEQSEIIRLAGPAEEVFEGSVVVSRLHEHGQRDHGGKFA